MKSFNGIALGLGLGALFLSGCQGVNEWWAREHALKPLKEQYWNGELSWNEYRDKKEALIADLEQNGYSDQGDITASLREAIDNHHTNREAAARSEKAEDAIILKQDEAMIQDSEQMPTTESQVEGMAAAETATEAPTHEMLEEQQEIDFGMLSRSIKNNSDSAASSTVAPAPAAEPAAMPMGEPARAQEAAPVPTTGQEVVTDSTQVKWKKQADGTVIYEDPTADALEEQVVE